MKAELYCKLFIHTEMPMEELFDLISLYLKGRKSGIQAIQTDLLEFDLRNNDEYFPGSSNFCFGNTMLILKHGCQMKRIISSV